MTWHVEHVKARAPAALVREASGLSQLKHGLSAMLADLDVMDRTEFSRWSRYSRY